jgi:transcriptional regulator CBF1
MSDMDLEHSGLQEVANAMRGDNITEGPGQKRKRDSESADDTRRGTKRISPTGNKDQQDGGVEALQDYNSLHQGHLDNHNGSAEHASTAAAALAGIYPTMTVPQPTDVSFATQGSDSDRNPESSFMDNSQQQDSFMENSTPSGRGSGNKPAVGSDEWHKVRKDNHKEGEWPSRVPLVRVEANMESS